MAKTAKTYILGIIFFLILFLFNFSLISSAEDCTYYDFNCDGKITKDDLDVIAEYWRNETQITMRVVTGARCEHLINFLAPYWQKNINNGRITMSDFVLLSGEASKCIGSTNSPVSSGPIVTGQGTLVLSDVCSDILTKCKRGINSACIKFDFNCRNETIIFEEDSFNSTGESVFYKNKEITISPSTAKEVANISTEGSFLAVEAIKLKEKQKNLLYEIQGKKEGKVIGLFKVNYSVVFEISAENGTIINIDKPWYSIFIS